MRYSWLLHLREDHLEPRNELLKPLLLSLLLEPDILEAKRLSLGCNPLFLPRRTEELLIGELAVALRGLNVRCSILLA